jgi:hypothetical protein
MNDAALDARPDTLSADGTATEGRKGIAYLRDYYVVAALSDSFDHLSSSSV